MNNKFKMKINNKTKWKINRNIQRKIINENLGRKTYF